VTPPAERPDLAKQVLVLAGDLARLNTTVTSGSRETALRLSNLRTQVEAIGRRLDEQDDLSGQIRELKEAIDELSASAAEPTVWDWSTMDAQAAEGTWAALVDWVNDIADRQLGLVGYHRKTDTKGRVTRLPPCWPLHRDVIWIVSWLCQEWLRVWQTSAGTPAKQGDWYTRLWPGALARLSASSAVECVATGCTVLDHGYGWDDAPDALQKASAGYRAEQTQRLRVIYARAREQNPSRQVTRPDPRSRTSAPASSVLTNPAYRQPGSQPIQPRDAGT
jgi:hypothetical protein